MIENAEEEAKEQERIEEGRQLVETYLRQKGTGPGAWAGPQRDRYLLRTGERQLSIPEDALGDSGCAGQLTPELRGYLDAALRGF